MKKWFAEPKFLFTLLMIISVIAIGVGAYLGFALGTPMPGMSRILPFLGIVFWAEAWCEFLAMCLRLRRGNSAFTAATGKTLRHIGLCMAGLAILCVACALVGAEGQRFDMGYDLIGGVFMPGIFLSVAVVAKILQDLLTHAMALEKEQEGVV